MKKGIRVLTIYIILAAIVIGTAIVVELRMENLGTSITSMQDVTEEYIASQQAVHDMREASDFLTARSREYAFGGDVEKLEAYLNEVNVDKRRDKALETLRQYQDENEAYQALVSAVNNSNALAEVEMYAMYMAAEAFGMEQADKEKYFGDITLSSQDAALSVEEKKDKAIAILLDENYQELKDDIITETYISLESLIEGTRVRQIEGYEKAADRLFTLRWVFFIMAAVVLASLIVTAILIIAPLSKSAHLIKESKHLPEKGAAEYVYLAHAYNTMLDITKHNEEQLSFDATHDELTGLYNRKVFEERREEHVDNGIAMLLIDVDYFKSVNDTYGHEMGDKVLKTIAGILSSSFRAEDYVCRIGGDEFAVIMKHMYPALRNIVQLKVDLVREKLSRAEGIPETTLSIGVAFSADGDQEDVFRKADAALYDVKEKGRNGYAFYKE